MEENALRYRIDRPTSTEKEFQNQMGIAADSQTTLMAKAKKKVRRSCTFSRDCVLNFFSTLFPILSWMKNYQKRWIVGDIVSGITVGIVHIPQGMAFAVLAGLAPVYGLYTSIYPVLVYTLMGTSRHISVGTSAVTSLMTRSVVFRYYPPNVDAVSSDNATLLNSTAFSMMNETELGDRFSDLDLKRAGVASALALLMGIFQLTFGILRFGFILSYISESLIEGISTGIAFQVVTSQVPAALGISIKPFSGPLAFFHIWIEIFKNIPNIHVPTLVLSIVCLIFLTAGREINKRFKEKMKIPLPSEAIVFITAILASHFGKFKQRYDVRVVDHVPVGSPAPVPPDTSILGDIIADGFALAVVGFTITASLAKIYGIWRGYSIDANQELLAYGSANIIQSFFLCFPCATSMSRCEIQANTGGSTQVVGIVSVIVVLIVVMVVGPVFEPLPVSTLACIIIVALFGFIAQLKNLKPLYKVSKIEFVIWTFSAVAILMFGVNTGLFIGISFGMVTLVLRTQFPRFDILTNVDGTDIYRDAMKYKKWQNSNAGIIIVKMHSSLCYVNKDYFKRKLLRAVGFDPFEILMKKKRDQLEKTAKSNKDGRFLCCVGERGEGSKGSEVRVSEVGCRDEAVIEVANEHKTDDRQHEIFAVIVDCATNGFVDHAGGKLLTNLAKQFNQLGIKFYLSECNLGVREQLRRSGFINVTEEDAIFVSLHDAVLCAVERQTHDGSN